MSHVCGQHDPRLALLMLNVSTEPVNAAASEGGVVCSGMPSITVST